MHSETMPVCQVGGAKVDLKRVKINIPAGHDLSGLTFVIRSADSTAWWRDGEQAPSWLLTHI